MRKVLALITASYGGGAERLLLNQIKYHNRKKIDFYVISLRKGNLENEFRKYKKYHSLDLHSRFSLPGLFKLIYFIKKNKIEVLHTHLLEADFYGFLVKIFCPKIRLISTKHNSNDFRKKLFWGIFNKIISLPAQVIAVSDAVNDFIKRYEFIYKAITIHNGIDTKRFRRKDTTELRRELGIKKSDFVIGIIGRLHEQKGHKFLFKAIAELRNPKIKLLVVGTGPLELQLKGMVKKLGIEKNVFFLGFRKDIPELDSLFDVFCLPSLYEGLPLVLAEAMSCGALVVCSDIPNNREVVENGKDGITFKTGNSHELARILLDIYSNPRKYDKIRKKARKKVIEKFDYKTNLKKIEEMYLK